MWQEKHSSLTWTEYKCAVQAGKAVQACKYVFARKMCDEATPTIMLARSSVSRGHESLTVASARSIVE